MFGRSKSSPPEDVDLAKTNGKGRPTPTRKEAEAARKQRLNAPKSRKEQSAASRQQTREYRSKQRAAMESGDDRYLPARDQGPVKRYVRDWVDSRRTVGELILPIFVVVFVISIMAANLAAIGAVIWVVMITLMVGDSIRVARGAKSAVVSRFGADQTKGVAMYAVMRGWQMRRLRLPKPQVSSGAKI